MGMQVGNWRFPEDVINNRVLILTLINALLQRGIINQQDIDDARIRVQDELMRIDPNLRFGPPPTPPQT